jgi:iron complex outermembrane receptor protein
MHCRSLALGLCFCTASMAATPLPPILISAARTAEPGLDIPAAKTVVYRQDIEDSGARDVAELLRQVTGVHVSDAVGDGSSASIDIRGFGSTAQSNVAVMINGRKINPATDTATLYLNTIDLDTVERIEIIEGSAGTLYGNQAVGGLINVITTRPDSSVRRARAGAGSYDGWELLAGITERIGENTGLSVQAHKRDSDNYRDHNTSRLERFDGRLEIDHHAGYSYADVQLLRDYVQTPGALLASELAADRRQAVFPNDYLDTDSKVARIGTRQQMNTHWRLEAELALRDDHRDFVQSFRGFPGSRSTQDRDSTELTPRLVGRYGDKLITLGLDYLSTDYRLVTAFGPQGNDQDITAAYAQLTRPLSPGLSLTAGIRHARVDNAIDNGGVPVDIDDSVTVGSLGFVYRPDAAWRLFLRADQNYRFAKVDEHTNVPFGQPVGLETQRGTSYETGAEYDSDGLHISVSAFQLRLRDEISYDASTYTNVNLPNSRRNGLTLTADTGLSDSLRLGAGYGYIDAKIRSGTHAGKRVPLVPEHQFNLYAEWRPLPKLLLRLDAEYVGEQFLGSDFDNASPPLDSYIVANLVAHYDLGDWRFSAKINNLFNELYSETGASSFAGDGFNPSPERNVWIGASYVFED